ncbi:iron-sulfur cluster co-chaperone protein HscB, mitochondrial [Canna indica]|uniref:Iron-sulfur cluster co-chaperone protein HscB, mitochondrial n=1 Tax=Canna indica TaxID=4628 RepID=A0AAQ3PZG2_9LILI|nr:iron-sulfur cluster co-chaperone protein HscB, mitochondrial [Canna indica]
MRTSKNCSLFSLLRTRFEELLYEKTAKGGVLVGSTNVFGRTVFCLNNRPYSIFLRHFDLPSNSPSSCHHVFPKLMVTDRLFCSVEASNGESPRCWNCNGAAASPGPFLACGLCGSVQPLNQSVDFFEIFGLEKAYDMKDKNLETKYKDWQKKLHPDLVHSKSEKEKAFAAEQSARVIDAYQTLSKPLLRAIYLLKLEGIHVDEEKTVTYPDMLAEMLEIREAVDEANESQALKQIQTEVEAKFLTWSKSFEEAFKRRDFDDAITSIERMRYYDRALEEITKKL